MSFGARIVRSSGTTIPRLLVSPFVVFLHNLIPYVDALSAQTVQRGFQSVLVL